MARPDFTEISDLMTDLFGLTTDERARRTQERLAELLYAMHQRIERLEEFERHSGPRYGR